MPPEHHEIKEISPGELYLDLESVLDNTTSDKCDYLIGADDDFIGIMRTPDFVLYLGRKAPEFLTVDEFREEFHNILDLVRNNKNGKIYLITKDGKPAACIYSKKQDLEEVKEAWKIIKRHKYKMKIKNLLRNIFS